MGSLMSGWSSTVLGDDKKVRLMRNRSLTKEEVDAFWRQHGGRPDNSGQQGSPLGYPRLVVSSPPPSPGRSDDESQQERPFEATRRLEAIRSLPPSPLAIARGAGSASSHDRQQYFSSRSEPSSPAAGARADNGSPESAAAYNSPSASCDWWTRSSWAFLNEVPHEQEEVNTSGRGGRAHETYACDRSHVARIVTGNA